MSIYIHPLVPYLLAVKRILQYLQCTFSYGVVFKSSIVLHLQAFVDADRSLCSCDRRSILGVVIYLGANPHLWSSKKQSLVSRSSTNVEYCVIVNASAFLLWIKALLTQIQCPLPSVPVVWCDNMSTLTLASNLVLHARNKHVELDLHFICEKVLSHQLSVQHILTNEQPVTLLQNHSAFTGSCCYAANLVSSQCL